MKPLAFWFVGGLTLSGFASDVKPGDKLADVRLYLGAPNGEVRVGDREIFYYDRGEIEAKSGMVTRASLRTEEEQTALEAKRAREVIRAQEEREIRQARLNAEGEELKARKFSDASFRNMPLSYQTAFWEDFSRRYPAVGSAEQLNEVRARLVAENEEERKRDEQNQRLADLEARLAIAENEAKLNRGYDYGPYGFTRRYPSFGNYISSRASREHVSPQPSLTRMYEYPLPYATSPGMPPTQPVYRKYGFTDVFLNQGNSGFSDGRGCFKSPAYGYRQF